MSDKFIVELDRPRELRLNWGALEELQSRLGNVPGLEIAARLMRFDYSVIVTALWLSLRHEDKKLSRDQVQTLIDQYVDRGGNLFTVLRHISGELQRASGLVAETGEEAKGKAEAAGPTSGGG